jgi:hypothetical protein
MGVTVSDLPTGPFRDALGGPLIVGDRAAERRHDLESGASHGSGR